MQKFLPLLAALAVAALGATAADKSLTITVSAGNFDRHNTLVSFQLPAADSSFATIYDDKQNPRPLQVDADGRAWFVVGNLPKGTTATYVLATRPAVPPALIQSKREKTSLTFSRAAIPLLTYQAEPSALPRTDIPEVFQRGTYIHPVYTLTGKVVTDHYPPNHMHQDGIFMAWTQTEFQGRRPDFWNLKDKKGRVEFAGLGKTWNGPVHGGFISSNRFVDLTSGQPIVVLNETWNLKVFALPAKAGWIFDLTSIQRCAGSDPLKLPKYIYGGFGYRGNWAWNGEGKCQFLTSEGITDRIKGNDSTARWCDIWGLLNGAEAGIAVLGHPQNFRAPQPVRLHPNEPYFSFAPQIAGPFEITPGQDYISRFRFYVHDGKPDAAEIDRIWNDYANPPEVKIVSN